MKKIPNPWPYYGKIRATCKCGDKEVVVVTSTSGPVEVPEAAEAALLEAVKFAGRGGKFTVLGPPKIWSEEFGLLDPEDWEAKMQIKQREAQLSELVGGDEALERRLERQHGPKPKIVVADAANSMKKTMQQLSQERVQKAAEAVNARG